MVKTESWFVTVRAEQLATVALTRREDVVVTRRPEGDGPDLLASVLQNGRNVGRYLGVEVKASVSSRDLRRREQAVEVEPRRLNYGAFEDIPFPVCLLFFTMDDDQGYWKWIRQPLIDPRWGARLTLDTGTTLSQLTNEALNTIITTVNRWYDARPSPIAA